MMEQTYQPNLHESIHTKPVINTNIGREENPRNK